MRRVRTLRLSARDHRLIRRGSVLVEDALRTASLPDGDGGRLVVVRSLDVGSIQAGRPPSSVALAIERSFAELRTSAVHAMDASAATAPVVYFRDATEAHVLLESRLAGGAQPAEWFWHVAVPAYRRGQPRDEALRAVLFSALATVAGPAAAMLVVHELRRQDAVDVLLAALRWQDGPVLLRALGWSTTDRIHLLREQPSLSSSSTSRPVSSPAVRLVKRWVDTWGVADARSTWLAAAVLAGDKPGRLLDRYLLRRTQQLLSEVAVVSAQPLTPAAPAVLQEHAIPMARRQPADVQSADGPPQTSQPAISVRPAQQPTPSAPSLLSVAEPLMPTQRLGQPPSTDSVTDAQPIPPTTLGLRVSAAERQLEPTPSLRPPDEPWDLEEVDVEADRPPHWPEHSQPTDFAGLFFVLRLLERLGIESLLRSSPELIELDVPARILHHLALRLRVRPDDAVLLPLAGLDLDPTPADLDILLKTWLEAARRLCRRVSRMGLSELVRRPGRIQVTRTHLDVTFDLNQVDIRVRRGGLDTDPGWLPWFGRVVMFHYLAGEPTDDT